MMIAQHDAGGHQPLYRQIRTQLLERFAAYPLDTKLPTNRELAKEFGVALLTIKRALDTLAADGYIDRRQGRGTFLRSHERQVRSEQPSQPNGTVVIAIPGYFSYEYWKRVSVSEDLALKRGCSLSEHHVRLGTDYSEVIAGLAKLENPRGLLIDPIPGSLNSKVIKSLDALGIPVIIFSHCDLVQMTRHLITITPNWYQVGYTLAQELLQHGHRNIGYVEGEPPTQDGSQRIRGMQQALADAGLGKRELRRSHRDPTAPWSCANETAYAIAGEMLDQGEVTALISDSAQNALPIYRAAYDRHLRIPEQLSVIASGEWTGNERFLPPPLSCVYSEIRAEVVRAFAIIDHGSAEPDRAVMCQVVTARRGSVAEVPERRG
jgi:DNA-binding LacI/PurR family transcriptional regulator